MINFEEKYIYNRNVGYIALVLICLFIIGIDIMFFPKSTYYIFYFIANIGFAFFLYYLIRDIHQYKIYESYVQIKYPYSGKGILILNKDIVKVTHQDSFQGNTNFVFIYHLIKSGEVTKTLLILNPGKYDEITVLKHFQSKGIKLNVKTNKVKLKQALGLS